MRVALPFLGVDPRGPREAGIVVLEPGLYGRAGRLLPHGVIVRSDGVARSGTTFRYLLEWEHSDTEPIARTGIDSSEGVQGARNGLDHFTTGVGERKVGRKLKSFDSEACRWRVPFPDSKLSSFGL